MTSFDSSTADAALRTRFRIWVIVVMAILLGQPAWLIAVRFTAADNALLEPLVYTGLILLSLPAPVLMRLLETTPPNAIRLRPVASIFTIVLGTLWLQGWGIMVLPPWLAPGHFLLAVANFIAVTFAAIILSLRGRSPWWATVFGWLPVMLIAKFTLETAGLAALLAAVSVILGSRSTAAKRPILHESPAFTENKERPEH